LKLDEEDQLSNGFARAGELNNLVKNGYKFVFAYLSL